ncbi:30S ribosomal protein S2 [Escherichia coli]
MKSYIFGARSKVHIINLGETVPMFDDANELHQLRSCQERQGTVRRYQACRV